jgi:hypothetical protein
MAQQGIGVQEYILMVNSGLDFGDGKVLRHYACAEFISSSFLDNP